ncbi:type IV pilus assembly protein PilX [Variovorax boronicumulans]|uniref:pilus assembly PilX family protein n=1 Tax=Variovorax boronicumulans TaxID=436515 RepID=UPI002784B0A2|nr:PilX N-terminal domain-containing pilus assembly protein [Variovorax boronicumulans]MDQ0073244.1 type IV pilus assembly protein PilX [Variovorax boronicumulans]
MKRTSSFRLAHQRGVSLIIVLLLLVIVSILGVGAAQIATMGERSARNDRDMQIAWQSAEAALMDAEFDIHGPGTSSRQSVFTKMANTNAFVSGCGDSGNSKGLCTLVTTGQPAWLAVDFTITLSSAKTAAFGDFTGRTFPAGATGIQPAKAPRYVIEPIEDPANRDVSGATTSYVYRVTAMGFGPRDDIQGVVQILYRD